MKHFLLALSCLPFAVFAMKFPVRQTKRDNFGVTGVTEINDVIYINVTVASQTFPVQLDTGSSDLWINTGNSALGNQSNINVNVTYGIGYAAGPIATAPMSFSGFDIPSQPYLAAQQVYNPAMHNGAKGVLGGGVTAASPHQFDSGGSFGRCLLYNIFLQNPNVSTFTSLSLQRNADTNDGQGSFTIGEYVPEYAAVANTAPIPTFPDTGLTQWTVAVDQIIANGQKLSLSSAVKDAPSNKTVGLLDTGSSFVYAPQNIVTSIYGSIPGATYSDSLGSWIVPCDTEIDVSIVIGGRQFDIHPLDTVQPTTSDPQTCMGSWLPQSLSGGNSNFDIIFGLAVIRSIYTVYDYGEQNITVHKPSMRLWSVVNGSDASAEFHQARGGVVSHTFLSNNNVNAALANATSDSDSDFSDLKTKVDNILKCSPIALGLAGLNILVLLVVLIVTIVACVRRRKDRRAGLPSDTFAPKPLGGGAYSYRPVSLKSNLREDGSQLLKYGPGARYDD